MRRTAEPADCKCATTPVRPVPLDYVSTTNDVFGQCVKVQADSAWTYYDVGDEVDVVPIISRVE